MSSIEAGGYTVHVWWQYMCAELGSVAKLEHEASLEACELAEHAIEGLLARQEGRAEVVRPLRLPEARAQEA